MSGVAHMKLSMNRTILPALHALVRATPLLALAVLSASFMLVSATVSAQTTSTIQGTVTDHQGLAINGAELQLSSDVLGTNRVVRSDDSGNYQFAAVPAGTYSLKVSHSGFAARLFDSLEVTLNRTLTFNVTLELGRLEEVVNVSAELPLLETNSSSSGATILPQEIEDMPINGRNYLDFCSSFPAWPSTARPMPTVTPPLRFWASAPTTLAS